MIEGNPQAIDFDLLLNLEQDTSRALMPELIDIFLVTAATRLDHIKTAIGNADTEVVAQEAHALKGSSSTFGANEVRRLCVAMENAARAGQNDGLSRMASDLEHALETAKSILDEHVETLTENSN